jgi:hypothetical protein
MEILLAFLVMMILIAAFSHGGRQSASDSIKEGISDSVEIARDSWKWLFVIIVVLAALFYFGYLQ